MHTDAFRDASNTSTLLYSYLFILFFTSLLRFFSSFSFFTRWRLSYTMRVLLFVVINLPCGPESFARSLIKRRGSRVMFHFREGVCIITAAFCSHFSIHSWLHRLYEVVHFPFEFCISFCGIINLQCNCYTADYTANFKLYQTWLLSVV